ncbi:uncharacterized protein EI90DRAFT_3019671 [Cantharellus anzutake]|uniref:uncharacterized protein n=1 Tax=Cantharellus anzutake TaxID=1750568 RepID=UPI001902C502|nr:uncharacterized protein EI90DRAFT_3019671 [Cantharellus anzutake]KAF8324315.1 hypothetical protein EI90DRAFT_3019671 [Cantharellus anzutake]
MATTPGNKQWRLDSCIPGRAAACVNVYSAPGLLNRQARELGTLIEEQMYSHAPVFINRVVFFCRRRGDVGARSEMKSVSSRRYQNEPWAIGLEFEFAGITKGGLHAAHAIVSSGGAWTRGVRDAVFNNNEAQWAARLAPFIRDFGPQNSRDGAVLWIPATAGRDGTDGGRRAGRLGDT